MGCRQPRPPQGSREVAGVERDELRSRSPKGAPLCNRMSLTKHELNSKIREFQEGNCRVLNPSSGPSGPEAQCDGQTLMKLTLF